jgi:hypothetical protein
LSPALKRLTIGGVFLCVALSSMGGGWLWGVTTGWRKAEPALLANLDGVGSSGQNAAFKARLAQRFPIGSPASALTAQLREQGFVQIDWGEMAGGVHAASWSRSGFPCLTDARVTWATGPDNRIRTIDGLYGYACP